MSISGISGNNSINPYKNSSITSKSLRLSEENFFSVVKQRENGDEFAYLFVTQNGHIGDGIKSLKEAKEILTKENNSFTTGAQSENLPKYLDIKA